MEQKRLTGLAEIMALASGVKTTASINSGTSTRQMLSDSQHWGNIILVPVDAE